MISVMHEAQPLKSAKGTDFYDSALTISGGVATKAPLGSGLPAEITAILAQTAVKEGYRSPGKTASVKERSEQ